MKNIEWLGSKEKNRMIIVDLLWSNLKIGSIGAIIKKWDNWLKNGKIIEIKKGIEDTRWQELKEYLIRFCKLKFL